MTRFPLLRLVAAPTPDAEVLYDFNDTILVDVATKTLSDGFTVGVPSLQGDVDAPGVQWGDRTVKAQHVIRGSKVAALGCQTRLARVLLRPRVWVMHQLDRNTAPVWWHAWRSQPDEVSLSEVWVDQFGQLTDPHSYGAQILPDRWVIGVALVADDFGYGTRVALAPVMTSAAVSHRTTMPAVTGDAPTHLRVQVERTDGSAAALGQDARLLVVASAADADPTRTLSLGAGSWSRDSDTTVTAGRATTAFDDTAVAPRVTGTVTTVEPGTYSAYLRTRGGGISTVARTLTTVLQVGGRPGQRVVHSLASGMTAQWLDLGPVTAGVAQPADLPQVPQAGPFVLSMGTDVTGWALAYDQLLLVPVTGEEVTTTTLKVESTTLPAGDTTLVVDGDTETAWLTGTNPAYTHGATGGLPGGMPTADPAAGRNTLIFLPGARNVAGSAAVEAQDPTADGATYELTVSYHPRLLWLGDGQPSPLADGTP